MENVNQDKIDRYLLGQQGQDEKKSFEELMEHDIKFAKEMQVQQAMFDYLETLGDMRLVETVEKVHQKAMEKNNRQARIRPIRWFVAVAAALLLLATFWFILQRPPLNEQLYQAYYEPYNILFGERDTGNLPEEARAGLLYQQHEYESAILLFEKALVADPEDSKARLAAGICYLETKQFERAFFQFDHLVQNEDALYLEQAQWYSALTLLHQNQLEECKKVLNQIAEKTNHFFRGQATNLLRQLS